MNFRVLNTIICSGLFALDTAHAAPKLDVTKIVGKNMKQVAGMLGKPGRCREAKHGPKCQYRDGQVEIVFIDGKADWISVNGLEEVPFTDEAIQIIGLAPRSPSFSSPFVKRWTTVPGISEVSIFKGRVGCDYAYLKVHTQ